MSKMKKDNKLKEKKEKLDKKFLINKKIVFLLIILLLILLIVVLYFVGNHDKDKQISESTNDNTSVFEEKTNEEQKSILLNILNQEISKYEEICTDDDNEDCINEAKKNEIISNFEAFKEKLNNLENNSENVLEQLKQDINDYLITIEPNVEIDDLINEEIKDEETNEDNQDVNNNEETNNNYIGNGSIESILNSAKLNPIKTGYSSLDNKVSSVINSVTNSSMSTYEKVKAVYDWVINNMSYQIGFIVGEEIDALINNYGFYEMDATQIFLAMNGFATKKGSCDNYSAMFMILTRRIGLDSYVVGARNNDGSGHTTVNIKINGKYYNFDTQMDDKSAKNGKIMYYGFGKSDSEVKTYTYIDRNGYISSFHKFNKQPDENYLKASITINGKTYSTKTLTSKNNLTIPDTIEVDYILNPKITIKLEADRHVTYMWTSGGYTNLDWEHSSIDGKATTDRYGEITINQTYSAKYDYTIHVVDENGREINFIIHFNFRDTSKKLSINANSGDFSYNDYILVGVSSYDSVGNVSYTAKVIETNDPRGVSSVLIEPSNVYTFKFSNLDRSNYYYKIEITGVDEAGNIATDIITSDSL